MTRKFILRTRDNTLTRVLVLVVAIITISACSPEDCEQSACVVLVPTAEDLGSISMYKSGKVYRFLSNSKDTFTFVASSVVYYEYTRDFGYEKEGCREHYGSLIYAKVRLTGVNNYRHMNFILSTWNRTANKNNFGITQICSLTLDIDSASTFFIERENPSQRIGHEEITDSLFYSQRRINNFMVLGKTYNDVYCNPDLSFQNYDVRYYYHYSYGLLKLKYASGETLELIQ